MWIEDPDGIRIVLSEVPALIAPRHQATTAFAFVASWLQPMANDGGDKSSRRTSDLIADYFRSQV